MIGRPQACPSPVLVHCCKMMPQAGPHDLRKESTGIPGCAALGPLGRRKHQQCAGFGSPNPSGLRGFFVEYSESRRTRQILWNDFSEAWLRRSTSPFQFWFLDPRRGILLVPRGCHSPRLRGSLGCQIRGTLAFPFVAHNKPRPVAMSADTVVNGVEPAEPDQLRATPLDRPFPDAICLSDPSS